MNEKCKSDKLMLINEIGNAKCSVEVDVESSISISFERQNVYHLFECFCEVVPPSKENNNKSWIIQKYPESFKDSSVLDAVPKFAFPCEFDRTKRQDYSFVLTDVNSKWTFGYVLHDPHTQTAFVILTYLNWHDIFRRFLYYIFHLTQNRETTDLLWKFLDDVYQSKLPELNDPIVISAHPSMVSFRCAAPYPFGLPTLPENRHLSEYRSSVNRDTMMLVFASMLHERRIIFTSKSLSHLSVCLFAAHCLIHPMCWQHIFIPVLPQLLIEYLLAPMPFLIGVPHSLWKNVCVPDLGDVVVIDVDNNSFVSPFDDIKSLPSEIVSNLKKRLSDSDSSRGDHLARSFLKALVELMGGYRAALKMGPSNEIYFDGEAFVETRPPNMQPFLRKMLELQLFQQFIEDRLKLLNAGKGVTDDFEMEVYNYSDKYNSKLMSKDLAKFIKNVKNKANPAVRTAVRTVTDRSKDVRSAYRDIKGIIKAKRKPNSAPSSPTTSLRNLEPIEPTAISSNAVMISSSSSQSKLKTDLSGSPTNTAQSPLEFSPLDMDLMGDLHDYIFQNQNATTFDSDDSDMSVKVEPKDLISLDSLSILDFDPLTNGESGSTSEPPMLGVMNPLYPYYSFERKQVTSVPSTSRPRANTNDLLGEYGLTFNSFRPINGEAEKIKSPPNWIKFD